MAFVVKEWFKSRQYICVICTKSVIFSILVDPKAKVSYVITPVCWPVRQWSVYWSQISWDSPKKFSNYPRKLTPDGVYLSLYLYVALYFTCMWLCTYGFLLNILILNDNVVLWDQHIGSSWPFKTPGLPNGVLSNHPCPSFCWSVSKYLGDCSLFFFLKFAWSWGSIK